MRASCDPVFELSGGCLALDFANTWGDRSRLETDKLASYRDLLSFASQVGILDRRQAELLTARAGERPAAAERALVTARELREALYRIFSGQAAKGGGADTGDLGRLSRAVADGVTLLHLEPDGPRFAWRWRDLESSLGALLTPIAWSAAELLTRDELERVRECDGDRCTWLFVDSSRNRSRRWCSMESCGNRAKARRHYRRNRPAVRRASG